MEYQIKLAKPSNRAEIVGLYKLSQAVTGIPDSEIFPPSELGSSLYSRLAVERYVACTSSQIIGHALIEQLSELDQAMWQHYLDSSIVQNALAWGAAFVHPDHLRKGIGAQLLLKGLNRVNELNARPVSATWQDNEHVARLFERFGGRQIAAHGTGKLAVRLFFFE